MHEDCEPREGLTRLARDTPDRWALADNRSHVTYGELLPWVEAVARDANAALSAMDRPVFLPLPVTRSLESAVAVLACMSGRIPFLPIPWNSDPNYVASLLSRTGRADTYVSMGGDPPPCIPAGVAPTSRGATGRVAPVSEAKLTDDAMVSFTSGTTGEPKGMVLTWESMFQRWRYRRRATSRGPSVASAPLLYAPDTAFGVAMIADAAHGLSHVLLEPRDYRPVDLVAEIASFQLTYMACPAQLARVISTALADDPIHLPSVRTLVIGGEGSRYELVSGLLRALPGGATLAHNLTSSEGGRTLHFEIPVNQAPSEGQIPVGTPVFPDRVRMHKVAGQPEGVRQVWVSGAIASRYLDNADLNAARFAVDEFGTRWWVSGDLVEEVDGIYWHRGRIDDVVKVRGRVASPADVTAALESLTGVRQALVLPEVRRNTTRLVAHVEIDEGCGLDPESIRSALARSIPEYLIPSSFRRHERLPISARGKIDRRQLADGPFLPW